MSIDSFASSAAPCRVVRRTSPGLALGWTWPYRALALWRARLAYRRQLARLGRAGPHLLRDIGLDEAEARAQVGKPFWRA